MAWKLISKQNESGAALIIVLFVFALSAVLVSSLLIKSNSSLGRAKNYFERKQAMLLCLSGEEISREMLYDDFKKSPDIDYMNEEWAKSGHIYPVEGGYIEVSIIDAQGMFNINSILLSGSHNGKMLEVFTRILDLALKDTVLAKAIAVEMADWIDPDKNGDYEEAEYLEKDPSYRPPNKDIMSTSEIRLLKSMTAESYRSIKQKVGDDLVALPAIKMINVNTVTAGTLSAFAEMDLADAEMRVNNIRSAKDGYRTPADALGGLELVNQSLFGVKSEYFKVMIRAKFGDQYAYLVSFLHRDPATGGSIEIIDRDFSKKFIFDFSKDKKLDQSKEYRIKI